MDASITPRPSSDTSLIAVIEMHKSRRIVKHHAAKKTATADTDPQGHIKHATQQVKESKQRQQSKDMLIAKQRQVRETD